MVMGPSGKEPLGYKITATLEDLLEKKPKETILALIGGITVGVISNYFPNTKEAYFTLQPFLTPEGVNYIRERFSYIKGAIKRRAKEYALKVVEYGSLLSQE